MLSGVFGTAVGHTTQFGDQANSYLGLCGILIGVGEIVGKLLLILCPVEYLYIKPGANVYIEDLGQLIT